MQKYLKILLRQMKNGLSQRMIYPINFFIMSLGAILQMLLALIFVQVIFNYVNSFAGWSRPQAMIIVASYMIVEGMLWATVAMVSGVATNIRTGLFDVLLTKPISPQFMASVWRSDPEDWMRVVTAMIVFASNVPALNLSSTELIINGSVYILLLVNAYIIVYSIFLMIKTINFWVINGNSMHMIGEVIIQSSKQPVDIFFHKAIRIIFSSVIPLAFIATVPAKILIHGPKLNLIIYSYLLAGIFFYISRKFFLYGLKHYESASS